MFAIDGTMGTGSNGTVMLVRCVDPRNPNPRKHYAIKACFNYGNLKRTSHFNRLMGNELIILRLLPTHHCIVRLYASFIDNINSAVFNRLPKYMQDRAVAENDQPIGEKTELCRTQFYVISAHARSLADVLKHELVRAASDQGVMVEVALPTRFVLTILLDVGEALLHCMKHRVVHLDVKPDNILIDGPILAPHAFLCDFGCAICLGDETMTDPPTRSKPDGNEMYRSPELYNALLATTKGNPTKMCYKMQPSFELGVLGFDILTGKHPVARFDDCLRTDEEMVYNDSDIEDLETKKLASPELAQLLFGLVRCDPAKRMDLESAVKRLRELYGKI